MIDSQTELNRCPNCDTPLRNKAASPQPVIETIVFAVSFLAFLGATHYNWIESKARWCWTGVQFILGFWLMRARVRAKKRVFYCARCESPLR